MAKFEEAKAKLEKESKEGKYDSKATAMKNAVLKALLDFAEQDEEFAQAVVDGGSFDKCMAAVAKGVGTSISDLDAYGRAVGFYFPGARIRMTMLIDLIGDAGGEISANEPGAGADGGLILDLSAFL